MNIKTRSLIVLCLTQLALTGCQKIASDRHITVKTTCEHFVAGNSVQNRKIEYFVMGAGDDVTFIMGAIHGDEPASTVLVNALIDHLKSHPKLLAGRKVVLMPVANPDGLAANSRFNARGIDLNRNFEAVNRIDKPEYGVVGLSEPESVIIKELLLKYEPDRILSLHQPFACIDYDGPADEIALKMGQNSDLEVKKLGARPGSLGSYAGTTLGIPIITVELRESDTGLDEKQIWKRYGKMLLASIVYP